MDKAIRLAKLQYLAVHTNAELERIHKMKTCYGCMVKFTPMYPEQQFCDKCEKVYRV